VVGILPCERLSWVLLCSLHQDRQQVGPAIRQLVGVNGRASGQRERAERAGACRRLQDAVARARVRAHLYPTHPGAEACIGRRRRELLIVVLLRRTTRLAGQEHREPLNLSERISDRIKSFGEGPDRVEQVEVEAEFGGIIGVARGESTFGERTAVGIRRQFEEIPGGEASRRCDTTLDL